MDALFFCGFCGIERNVRTLRIARDASNAREFRVIVGAIPVTAPFPNVSAHIMEAITVGWKHRDGRDAGETIGAIILDRKFSLIGIRHEPSARMELIAPGVNPSRLPS